MIATIGRVIRDEGIGSAARRAQERIAEALRTHTLLARGRLDGDDRAPILNFSPIPAVARLGGLPIQLRARLEEERMMRRVALYADGVLEVASHARRMTFEEAIAATSADAVHVEGTFDAPVERLMRLGQKLIVSVHDQSAEPALLRRAQAVIYPSASLRDSYGIAGVVIEPGIRANASDRRGRPSLHDARVAIVGSVKPHKGGSLLPSIISGAAQAEWHLFGGGDADLLRDVRRLTRAKLHGYYRASTLPSLLVTHRIGLAVLPSVVPEAFGLTLSECWVAGVPVIAFDRGALGERITKHGGGWVVPPSEGAEGIAKKVREWMAGELSTAVPVRVPTARDAALAHIALYRDSRLL